MNNFLREFKSQLWGLASFFSKCGSSLKPFGGDCGAFSSAFSSLGSGVVQMWVSENTLNSGIRWNASVSYLRSHLFCLPVLVPFPTPSFTPSLSPSYFPFPSSPVPPFPSLPPLGNCQPSTTENLSPAAPLPSVPSCEFKWMMGRCVSGPSLLLLAVKAGLPVFDDFYQQPAPLMSFCFSGHCLSFLGFQSPLLASDVYHTSQLQNRDLNKLS